MKFDIITIFPKIFNSYSARSAEQGSAGLAGSYFNESILRRAQKNNLIKIDVHDLRDYSSDKHKRVDDKPYGGGAGMIFKVEPIYFAVQKIKSQKSKVKITSQKSKVKQRIILFSAKGKTMTQQDVRQWAKYDQLILICGRYEGVDERVAEYIVDEEVSVGNYILTGGEIPAMIVVDAVSRLIPNVIKSESLTEESFNNTSIGRKKPAFAKASADAPFSSSAFGGKKMSEYPQYTRPEVFNNWKVPKVLLSGNHKTIQEWRKRTSKSK